MNFTTWGRTYRASPARWSQPRDEAELRAVVARAAADGLRVRAVGAGHSFTDVAVTDGLLIGLDRLSGLESLRRLPDGSALVTVGAGTRLHELNRLLATRGLAMRNLGDIDRQSVAGAISTGTHGTGALLGGLATQVRALRVVLPDGSVRSVSGDDAPGSPDRELFEVARLGLGTVGVLSAATLEVVPAYLLRSTEQVRPWDAVVEGIDALFDGHDRFDAYWFPGTDRMLTWSHDRVPAAEAARHRASRRGVLGAARTLGDAARSVLDEEVLANGVLGGVMQVATAAPRTVPRLNAVCAAALGDRTHVAPSDRVMVSRRRVRFAEMEYALPRAGLADVLRELEGWLRSSGEPVPFPVEVRCAAADDVWLSTARRRDTAYVAVHQYHRMPRERYFAAAEEIFVAAGGRPHWGKLHTRTAADLAAHYPLDDVARVRAAVDPDGVLRNDYTDRVLGLPA
ncbi:D-arabinono-1,4-lactone oxidase [Isoptericola sp. 178]|uniref:D-arabinono-1,4-lactone oxidase n=1 Tax=Isoptericola sp. 178 TaxID=3064651 RepID=UPI002712EAA9|nr:D-arabinono-1,4-lactone oxidase [Isoptericola sp. 178]MDO8143891.1 D-arabinono-1,4-lactone oxidase [Isoptericola sp. 178]